MLTGKIVNTTVTDFEELETTIEKLLNDNPGLRITSVVINAGDLVKNTPGLEAVIVMVPIVTKPEK